MFEPKYIGIYDFPHDLLKQLIIRRKKVLEEKNPSFRDAYQEIQTMLKRHYGQLKKNWSLHTDSDIIEKVLAELELAHYSFKTRIREKTYPKQFLISSSNLAEKREISTPPYHYKRFKRSLNKFQLSCCRKKEKLFWKHRNNNYWKKNQEILYQKRQRSSLIKPLKRF